MNILVISGFLGAGKTTFIKKMVEMTNKNFVILENEYGELGLDKKFLEDSTSRDINIWELTEGCICCSVKSDFATSILTIANSLDPEYLIVEPTGVGMLSNVLKNIQKIEYERITLLKPITIIDVNCYDKDMQNFPEIYKDQIANSNKIIFSKTEQLSSSEINRIIENIKNINNDLTSEFEHYSKKSVEWWDNLLKESFNAKLTDNSDDDVVPHLESISFENVCMNSIGELVNLLECVIQGKHGYVRRAKGCVKVHHEYLRFDVVDTFYSITGMESKKESSAVFIGKNLSKEIEKHMVVK